MPPSPQDADSVSDSNSLAFDFVELDMLDLPGLELSLSIDEAIHSHYSLWLPRLMQGIARLWPYFQQIASQEDVFNILGLDYQRQSASVELTWVGNAVMQQLNRNYRSKDAATDVLSFTLLADSQNLKMWLSLPQVQLGSLFISLDWALEAQAVLRIPQAISETVPPLSTPENQPYPADALTDTLFAYIMERVIHGCLHLHGRHHDTMPDFEKVVRIQQQVLRAAFNLDSQTSLPTDG